MPNVAKRLVCVFLILAVLLLGFPASCAKASLGVAKGDIFYYVMFAEYSSSNPDLPIEVPAFEANNTQWVRIEITSVNGSVVSHTYTLHLNDGSEQNITGQTDVSVNVWAQGNSVFRGVPICPANLKAGDTVPAVQMTINETVTKVFSIGERQSNHLTWNSNIENGECYFDQQTGMLLELKRAHTFINQATGDAVTKTDIIKITSTNLPTGTQPNNIIPIVLVAAAVASAAGLIYARRRLP